jgi:hypothetical protein
MRWPRRDRPQDRSRTGEARGSPVPKMATPGPPPPVAARPGQPVRKLVLKRRAATPVGYGM